MPKFSQSSKSKLGTCHQDLQVLFNDIIKDWDCTIVYGHRSVEEQQGLFAKGRFKPGDIVTYCDGVNKVSKHNHYPSLAVDVVPYPSLFSDIEEIKRFAAFVLDRAKDLKRDGYIDSDIQWGGSWQNFKDYPHYQIKL